MSGHQELGELDFDSVPKGAGLYLKKHWKGKLDRLCVTHLRDKGWLRDVSLKQCLFQGYFQGQFPTAKAVVNLQFRPDLPIQLQKSAYKKYSNSGDFVSIHGRMFRKNTGGLRDDLYQCLTEKDTLEEFPCIMIRL